MKFQYFHKIVFGIVGNLQEIVSAGGKTVWGNPSEIGKVLKGSAFDAVLDNNGKDLDTVRFVAFRIDIDS